MKCMDCWESCANAAIMWQCLPVPVFGDHTAPTVRVATIGLNPSATEFLDAGDWKPAVQRLPLVADFGTKERSGLSEENLNEAANQRGKYFHRAIYHPFFRLFQGLLSAVNPRWNYAAGSVVHVDLVACGTWRPWGELSQKTRSKLIETCHKHLKQTLTELPDGTLLLLDGQTVNKTLVDKFGVGERVEANVGEAEIVTVWRGYLLIEGKSGSSEKYESGVV